MVPEPASPPPASHLAHRPILIAGPTAVGKSELALSLAERLGGEIVSVDSMQVYRGMDLGTAKPSAEERARVPHHLLDVVEVSEPFDAAQFLQLARAAVAQIQARGRVPILCGGTGLYFKVFLEGLSTAPAADPALRAELRAMPLAALLQELAQRDPVTYERIDRHNPRRVIRAVEVLRLTGQPLAPQRTGWSAPGGPVGTSSTSSLIPLQDSPCIIGLSRAPEDLQGRINLRVEEMFARGLAAETEQLLQRGLASNPVALQALGYRQVVEYLQGERSLPATLELVKARTRQFAKRQLTWFRRQLPVRWVTVEPRQPIAPLVEQVVGEG